ncbi:MAG: hypothetical protein GC168_00680 [Candidatus Hydrogenedens sp.]|nr:hypothetical protein [Candidatus Hydrogenedens sp.]
MIKAAATSKPGPAFAGLVIAACAAAGLFITVTGDALPMLLAGAVATFFVSIVCVTLFGMQGALLFLPLGAAFFLMQRFDEGLAIDLGGFSFRGFYTVIGLLFAVFALVSIPIRTDTPTKLIDRENLKGAFFICFTGFLAAALLGFALNQMMDGELPDRKPLAELVAMYAIFLPMLYLPLALRADPGPTRTELLLHVCVGLGGLSGLILSAFGILPGQVLGMLGWSGAIGGTADLVRGRLPLGHPNHVAAVLNMLLPPAVVYGLLGRNALLRAFNLGCAGLMLCGVLFALSRGALLNLGIALAATLLYVVFARENRRWYTLPLVLLASLAVAGAAFSLFASFDFSRYWSKRYYEEKSVERRMDSMQTAVNVFLDYPVLGVTPDAVYPRVDLRPGWEPRFADSISPVIYYKGHPSAETPHNLYLIVPAEFGLVGAVCFFGLIGAMAYTLLRVRGRPGIEMHDRRMLTAYLIGLGAFMLSGMFEAVLMAGMRLNVIFWVFYGLVFVFAFHAVRRVDAVAADGRG